MIVPLRIVRVDSPGRVTLCLQVSGSDGATLTYTSTWPLLLARPLRIMPARPAVVGWN